MSSVEVREIKTPQALDEFIRFPFKVYKNNSVWVPPILQDQKNFLSGKSLYFEHATSRLFAAYEEGEIVAICGAFKDENFIEHWNEKVGFIGYFEALENKSDAVYQLIETAEEALREQGLETVWAPVNGSISNPAGFLVNAFNQKPVFLMNYNPSYYPQYFRRQGYHVGRELLAYTMDLMNGRLQRKISFALKRAKKSEIRIEPMNRKDFKQSSADLARIYSETFKSHWGYAPQSDSEVHELLEPLRLALDSDLILFAKKGDQVVGFTLCVPDYNEAIQKLRGDLSFLKGLAFLRMKNKIQRGRLIAIGVVPEWRGQGVAPLLVASAYQAMIDKGYTTCEYSWVFKDNMSSRNVTQKFYGDAYKQYDVYEKELA